MTWAAGSGRRTRDRRGRGMRGPAILPRVPGTPEVPTASERFDALVLDVAQEIEERWHDRLGLLEFAVEDIPQVPDDWESDRVPLATLVRASGATPARLVVFRRPIEHRCGSRSELEALVLTVIAEQIADLLGVEPHVIDPRLGDDE